MLEKLLNLQFHITLGEKHIAFSFSENLQCLLKGMNYLTLISLLFYFIVYLNFSNLLLKDQTKYNQTEYFCR